MGSIAACVHHSVSTHPGPPSGVLASSRPVYSPSSIRSSGFLVRTRLSGRPCPARPASSRLVSTRSHPSRPTSAGRWGLGTRRSDGATVTTGPSRGPHGPAPSPAAAGARRRPGCGTVAEVGWRASGGASAADWPGCASAGGCRRPTREARPPRGAPPSLAAATRDGELPAREVAARHRVAASLAWSPEHSAWSLWSLPPEWTGSKAPTSLAARMGTRPQRGPARKRARPAQRRQRCDLQRWWWARQGLNL
jgi:hypothetical protein